MGFRLNRVYSLRFDDYPQLTDFEVNIRATPVAVIIELGELTIGEDSARLAALLAEHVISWNYEDEKGETLPLAPESFLQLEQPLLRTLIGEWYRAAVGITAPLERTSTDTAPPELASVPMETL